MTGLLLAGCGDGGSDGGQGLVDGKTFTMVLGADPGTLDPHFTSLSPAFEVDRFLYDSLLAVNEKGDLVPNLAQKWEGDTGKATFTLRKDITCSDGTALKASDVAANISFVGDPKNESSRIGVFVPPGTTATGDDAAGTVTVTAAQPSAFLIRQVAGLQIVCPKGMQSRDQLKQGAVGTGMFTMTEAVPNDHYTLTRRKDYAWGPGEWKTDQRGLPDKVVIKIVTNETTAANLVMSGGANAVQLVGPDKQRLQGQKLFQRDATAMLGELWFNQKAGNPTANLEIRKALTQALDLKQLSLVVTGNTGKPANGLIPDGMGACKGDTLTGNLPAHDEAAAKTALGGQKIAVTLLYTSSAGPGMQAAAELMQKVWSGIGVDVTVKGVSETEIGTVVVGGQGSWTAALIPLNASLPSEIVPFLSGPSAPDGTNFSSIQNPQYDALVKEAAAMNGTDGCAKWAEAEKALFQRVDVVPFANSVAPAFGKGATFELSGGNIWPSSIRMVG
ncbi:ABC transporter substrate-binding protein [Virgisporangium aliadipatigenens]|nr:ABC transporter substrate-binding protein [Virgisporangium aliadipatigenens]